jgi:hypothetical protein
MEYISLNKKNKKKIEKKVACAVGHMLSSGKNKNKTTQVGDLFKT